MTFVSFRKTAHWSTCIGHEHSPTAAALSTYFLLNHAAPPRTAPSWSHIDYKISGVIQQREYESWVKKTEEVKQWLAEFWQCTDTAFEWKNASFVFPSLPGSAEVDVTWGGILKCLLIAYFIRHISATKISKCVHVCQSYSKSKVGRFLRHSL